MGGNPGNPDVNVLADTTNEGISPKDAPPISEKAKDEAPASSVVAQDAFGIYENQLAILQRDNEQLRERDRATMAKMKELYSLLQTPDGENVEERVNGLIADKEAAEARIGTLQIALGIGPTDDPERAAGALKARNRLANVDPTSNLPAFGHLLLMTTLARLDPILGRYYNSVPSQFRAVNGDRWLARVEESYDEESQPIRLVVIAQECNAYAHEEARIRVQTLESDYAGALRENTQAEQRLAATKTTRDERIRKNAEDAKAAARKRGAEIKEELERLRPLAENPEVREWRFNADLENYTLLGGE